MDAHLLKIQRESLHARRNLLKVNVATRLLIFCQDNRKKGKNRNIILDCQTPAERSSRLLFFCSSSGGTIRFRLCLKRKNATERSLIFCGQRNPFHSHDVIPPPDAIKV